MSDSNAKPAAKRYYEISRMFAIVAAITLGVGSWSATHFTPGRKSPGLSISIDIALGIVMAGSAAYFFLMGHKSRVEGR